MLHCPAYHTVKQLTTRDTSAEGNSGIRSLATDYSLMAAACPGVGRQSDLRAATYGR